MKTEKINAFKKELRELLEKHKATIDLTNRHNDPELNVFMKDEDRSIYVQALYFPMHIIESKSPELDTL